MPQERGGSHARREFLALLSCAGTAGVAGCAAVPGDSESTSTTRTGRPPDERTVDGRAWVEADSSDVDTLNWIESSDEASYRRISPTMDGPYAVTPDAEIVPLWCDITTEDNQVYTVTLRENLAWSDPYGAMTAEDWVYTIRNVFQGEGNWAEFSGYGYWHGPDDDPIPVEQTGTHTFEIRLPDVDPAFPYKPALGGNYCLPKGLLEQYAPSRDATGLDRDEEVQTLGYTGNLGPYEFDTWRRGSRFTATRNDDYYMHDLDDVSAAWRNAPYFEEYVVEVVPDQSSRLSAFRSDELTAVELPESKVDQFEGSGDAYVNVVPQPFHTLLVYNQRANGWRPFRKRAVRRALGYAVNKTQIVDTILRGYADVAHTFQPEWSEWYADDHVWEVGVGDRYGVEAARTRLADALADTDYGYDGDTLVGPNGRQVSLSLIYPTGDEPTQTTVEYVADAYADVGIDVTLQSNKENVILERYAKNSPDDGSGEWNAGPFNGGTRDESTSAEAWDMMYGITFNTFPRTPGVTQTYWTKRGGTNFFGYYPEESLVDLYRSANSTADEAERRATLAELFGVLSRDQPCNFVQFSADILAYRDGVRGPTEQYDYDWNRQTWYRIGE